MSWNLGSGIVRKQLAEKAIDEMEMQPGQEALDQLSVAKQAAKEVLKAIPGPYVSVSLTGHANGIGWQKKEGWSHDYITVVVTQYFESDIPVMKERHKRWSKSMARKEAE